MKEREVEIVLKIKSDSSIHILRQAGFWRDIIQTASRWSSTIACGTLCRITVLESHARLIETEEKSNGS